MKETLLSIAIAITKSIAIVCIQALIGYTIWIYLCRSWMSEDMFLGIYCLIIVFIDFKFITLEVVYKNKGEDEK